jgi:hypothetical protein
MDRVVREKKNGREGGRGGRKGGRRERGNATSFKKAQLQEGGAKAARLRAKEETHE